MPTAKVKVKVLKKLKTYEGLQQYGNNVEAKCPLWKLGTEFVAENINMPAGSCGWAWADKHKRWPTSCSAGTSPGSNRRAPW